MKEKLKAHYLKFGPRPFVIFTVLTLLIMDVFNGYYLRLYWLHKNLSLNIVRGSLSRGISIDDLSPGTIMEMTGLINNVFYFFLFLLLVNNLFFYLFYLKKKLWAQGYVIFYTLTGAILSCTFIFDQAGLGPFWMAFNLITIPVYLYLYCGVGLLKLETTLVSEKKGR